MLVMEQRKKEGVIFVNKPKGITSHDVVDIVRKRLKIRKVGHAGTLDPLAQGLLIILVGKYTKSFPKFVSFDKKYTGILKLGEVTATGDSQGEIINKCDYGNIDEDKLLESLPNLERRLGREINYSIYGPEEFRKKKKEGDGFINTVLKESKLVLLGNPDEL